MSPDGQWVAYATNVNQLRKDRQNDDLWMASWDGTRNVRLTRTEADESQPRWSPDGRYLAFVAARGHDEDDQDAVGQVWLLVRAGGEAEQLTKFEGDVEHFEWSPDGKQLAVVAWDKDHRSTEDEDDTPPPIVIDRYYFKEDDSGHLGPERRRLYLFDVETRKAVRLTSSAYDEIRPSWSPDGRQLAFLGREGPDPDRDSRYTLFVAEARAGATPRRLTTFQGENGDSTSMCSPRWSPDGKRIAFVGGGDPKLIYYATYRPFVIDVAGGEPRPLGRALDRNMYEPRWAADGRNLFVLLEDDRSQHLVRIGLRDDDIERIVDGRREVLDYDIARDGRIALLESTVSYPYEVFALDRGQLRPLSRQNDEWLARRQLATVEEIGFRSRDGA
jgi:Tol biopolymer transport system component